MTWMFPRSYAGIVDSISSLVDAQLQILGGPPGAGSASLGGGSIVRGGKKTVSGSWLTRPLPLSFSAMGFQQSEHVVLLAFNFSWHGLLCMSAQVAENHVVSFGTPAGTQ